MTNFLIFFAVIVAGIILDHLLTIIQLKLRVRKYKKQAKSHILNK